MKQTRANKGQRGQALLTAIIFLVALTFLGFGLITVATIDIHSSRNLRLAEEALGAAEEGALVGLAYAADMSNQFILNAKTDDSVNLFSTTTVGKATTDRLQYQVTVIKGAETECEAGSQTTAGGTGVPDVCFIVYSRSTGMVSEGITGTFSFTKPQIRNTVEIIARVKSIGGM